MEVVQVLHMNGGIGETSYGNNSLVQQKVICMTKPIRDEAITDLYCRTTPRSLVIADLGCASGPNTLFVVSELIKVVDKLREELGRQSPEYQVFLNDLPGNDFNTVFKSLPSFQKKMSDELGTGAGPCFSREFRVLSMAGFFRARVCILPILLTASIGYLRDLEFNQNNKWIERFHFQLLITASTFHLCLVPELLESNKGNINIASTSPQTVIGAYYAQFQRDFSTFLSCRAEELVAGGRMVLTFLGRRSEDPASKECCFIWELLATALNDMVSEGLIEEEKMDSFNIPQYSPSPSELRLEVQKEGSFSIVRLEVSEVNSSAYNDEFSSADAYNVAQCVRAVAEPLLVGHFGDAIIEEVFRRYREILSDRISKENAQFINVAISMAKKG
ncbi:Salicylate carboxymethyltransferase [Morella rubra]|uniref:Salicylate carboxymethyltransferase n=2 Tax=Morella rubra TaxID=262757 RepID=A0A6A1US60_9ROSI|nr:Salicylate carboxymethyltransferase [Morella rubra]